MVGSHLVELLLEHGDAVRALVRDLGRAEHLNSLGAEVKVGDLCEPATLKRALDGVEVVYHCAARVALPYQGSRAEIFKANVEGTSHLLEASVQAGVRRFVFVSSVAVYGNADEVPIREDHSTSPNGHYAQSKLLAERLVRQYHGHRGLETVILRPCVIYGPRDHNFLPQIFDALLKRRFPLVDGGRHLLDMVYVTDVAEALVLAAAKPEANGQIYNVTDGKAHTIRELIELFGKILGREPRTIDVPFPVAYGFAALSWAWSRLRRPSQEPLIHPGAVCSMARSHHYDISKIKEELGYRPKVELEEGLRRAIEWYLKLHGDLPG